MQKKMTMSSCPLLKSWVELSAWTEEALYSTDKKENVLAQYI